MKSSAPEASEVAPLVSIVIPVFNGARYLAEAIDSALAQSHQNLEVIVIDDGSDDGGATAAICAEYGDQIRYFRKPNGGVASALNVGISKMSGSYFSWLSHDDRYLPHKVRTQLDLVRDHPEPVVAFGDAMVIDANGNRRWQTNLVERWHPDFDARLLAIEGRLSGCTLLIPRVCFETCGVFDEARPTVQDADLWYRIGSRFKFAFCPEILVESRVHAEQGSAISWHRDEAALTLIDLFKRYMRDRDASWGADQPESAEHRFWRHHLRCSYPGLRRFCERLRLDGRQRYHVAVVAGGAAAGRVAETLVDAGFRDIDVVSRPVGTESSGPQADAAPGRNLPLAALSNLDGAGIVVLGFDDGRKLENLADEIDRVVGREADAVIWPESESVGPRLVARASALRPALDRIAESDLHLLPQELAMVAAVALCRPPAQVPAATAAADPTPPHEVSVKPVPLIVEASPPPPPDFIRDMPSGPEQPGEPASGIVPRIVDESRPRPGTERIRRVLSAPPLGRVIEGLASGMHRFAPAGVSRRAVAGVEWIYCARGRIDPGWYITQYPEVRAEGWHPSLHYLSRGWREGKDPSPHFSTTLNATFLPTPGHLNPLTRSALAGRSFATPLRDHVRWQPEAWDMAAADNGSAAQAVSPDAGNGVADDAAPAEGRETVIAASAEGPRPRAIVLILSDGTDDAKAWSLALAQAMRRRATAWRATLRDGALCDAVDTAGNPIDLQAAGLVHTTGRPAPLEGTVDRVAIIGSLRDGEVADLLSAGRIPYTVLPLSLSDVDAGTDLLRGAARVFAPTDHARRLINHQVKADAILMRPPDFGAAVRFPVSPLDFRPGEALRVLAVSGSPSSAEDIVEVARSIWRERIEIVATGPVSPGTAKRLPVPWLDKMPLVELVGQCDPHVLWLHSDLDFSPPFALVDVLRMGRPTLVSGSPVTWEGLAGRARTWNMVGRDNSAIVAMLAGLASGSGPPPYGSAFPEDLGLVCFPIDEVLS